MAALKGLALGFSKLLISSSPLAATATCNAAQQRLISTKSSPLLFWATPALLAEPLKKKKKIDPAVLKAREERRKKRLEKSIRKLERNALQLKPLEEMEIPYQVRQELKVRKRPSPKLDDIELERRADLLKEWTQYKQKQHLRDVQMMDRIVSAQRKALNELRALNEDLYFEATQIDLALVPFKARGPTATPRIANYECPDGEYLDVTRKWD